jgi:hypothetical protein
MDSSTLDSIFLDATARVEKAMAKHEQEFYAPQVKMMGRMVWEAMRPEQRQMTLDRKPHLADGIRKMLGGG